MIFVMQNTNNSWKVNEDKNEDGTVTTTIQRNKIRLKTKFPIEDIKVNEIESLRKSTEFIKGVDSGSYLIYDEHTFEPVALKSSNQGRVFVLLTEDLTQFDTNTVVKVEYKNALVFDYAVHHSEMTMLFRATTNGVIRLHIVNSDYTTRTIVEYNVVEENGDVKIVRSVGEGLHVPDKKPFRNKYLTMRPYRPFTATSVLVAFDKYASKLSRYSRPTSNTKLITVSSLEEAENEIIKLKDKGYTVITVHTDTNRGDTLPEEEFKLTRIAYKHMNLVHILHGDKQIQRLSNYRNNR